MFKKLQCNSLAFVAGFKRATDEGSLPEIAQYSTYYLPFIVFTASKGTNHYILVVIYKKVQEGKDQEKAQSEKDSHSKNRGGKKTN